MGYTLKDVVGAKLTSYVERPGVLILEFDNNFSLVVKPLPNSGKGLVVYPRPAQFVGQKVVNAGFEMSTKEDFYGRSENVDANEVHHRRLVLETEHRGLHIESVSFDVPPELQSNRNYSMY